MKQISKKAAAFIAESSAAEKRTIWYYIDSGSSAAPARLLAKSAAESSCFPRLDRRALWHGPKWVNFTVFGATWQMAKKVARSESIKVSVTPAMRKELEELAERDARSVSSWIELALRRAIEAAKKK